MLVKISKKVSDFIFEEETGGRAYYEKFSSRPVWPGGSSGITVGGGYDCGYKTPFQIEKDWGNLIPVSMVTILKSVAGLTGQKAANALTPNVVNGVYIRYNTALNQYEERVIKKELKKTVLAFPESDKLNPDTLGVLTSLVYNRGTDMSDNDKKAQDRREMREIKKLVPLKDYAGIAAQIRSMKRLWDGVPDYPGETEKKFGGLVNRREKEAVIVENSDRVYKPDELIEVEF